MGNFWRRLKLCWLVLRTPAAALAELRDEILAADEFYRWRRDNPEPPKPPITWKTKVKPGKTYTRPVFPIVEDDDE